MFPVTREELTLLISVLDTAMGAETGAVRMTPGCYYGSLLSLKARAAALLDEEICVI